MDLSHQIATLIHEASSDREGLDRALAAILDATGTTSGTVHVMPPGESILHLMASRDIPQVVLDKIRTIPMGKGMAGVAAESGQAVTTCNLQTNDCNGVIRQGARESGARGAVAVPLMRGTTAIGALGVATREPRDFTRAEIDSIIALGRAMAEALADS
jgi:signal transduction protein with GAF and PtsI domain